VTVIIICQSRNF